MGLSILKDEIVEFVNYYPGVQDSGDLESGTKTITATSEASGVGNADYNDAMTLAKPGDARIVIQKICARISFTIDSFDTATILNCRVYVDVQDADHLLIDTSHNAASNKLFAFDTHAGAKPVAFALIADGAEHTYYFFFWVNQATNAVISVVNLWVGVGSLQGNSTNAGEVVLFNHDGLINLAWQVSKVGSGTQRCVLALDCTVSNPDIAGIADNALSKSAGSPMLVLSKALKTGMSIFGSVGTDLNYLDILVVTFRSE